MAAWWGTRLGVFQSAGRGVSFDPMSVAVDAYDGQVDWWSLKEEHACDFDRDLLVETAFSELGKRYGYGALVRLVFRMTMQRFRFTPDPLAHPSTLFCSQYVSLCYRKAGLDLRLDAADDCTSPGDLATSEYLEQRGVLHRNGEQGPDVIAHEARRPPTRRRAEAPPRELAAL